MLLPPEGVQVRDTKILPCCLFVAAVRVIFSLPSPASARISQLPGMPKSSIIPKKSLLPGWLMSTAEPSFIAAIQLWRRVVVWSMASQTCIGPLFIGVMSPTKKLVAPAGRVIAGENGYVTKVSVAALTMKPLVEPRRTASVGSPSPFGSLQRAMTTGVPLISGSEGSSGLAQAMLTDVMVV